MVPPNAIMYDCVGLQGAPMLFVAVALVSNLCPNAKMYDLMPLLWFRSSGRILRLFVFEMVLQC